MWNSYDCRLDIKLEWFRRLNIKQWTLDPHIFLYILFYQFMIMNYNTKKIHFIACDNIAFRLHAFIFAMLFGVEQFPLLKTVKRTHEVQYNLCATMVNRSFTYYPMETVFFSVSKFAVKHNFPDTPKEYGNIKIYWIE